MRKAISILVLIFVFSVFLAAQNSSEAEVRSAVNHFQQALEQRDVGAIEKLVAKDLVVLENGHRNDGWVDFRDNHLIPEMKEPAPPSTTELIRITATDTMGWAYTRTTMLLTRKTGEKSDAELWSVYVIEKRGTEWKIALLDWSMRFVKASEQAATASGKDTGASSRWDMEKLAKRLKDVGLAVQQNVAIQQPFLTVIGRTLVVAGGAAEVQAYIYRDDEARERDTAKLDPERVAPPTTQVSWLMPASLITDKNLIVIVLTRDDTLRTKIKEAIQSANVGVVR